MLYLNWTGLSHSIIAINEKGAIYDYDRRVKWKIDRDCTEDYVKAAEYVNSSNIQLLVVQHEFGLYGGDYGEHIKLFLDKCQKTSNHHPSHGATQF